MPATFSSDTTKVKVGTCKVTYGGTELGLTMGGVELEVSTSTHESKVDQFGETTIKEIITGRNVTVTVPMAETTLENLVLVMPGSTLIGTGTEKVEVESAVGTDLLDSAQVLVLHPIANEDTDYSEDITIPKAAVAGEMQFAYKLDQERVYNSVFKGYPDTDNVLFTFGDPAATA